MNYIAYKHRKDILGFFEVALFRLFPSISIIGAVELGAATFLSTYGYLFFLALPLIDIGRCILYWNKPDDNDLIPHKKYWNRAYYTLRMVVNIIASSLIVLANDAGMGNLLNPGLALFVGGVVGVPMIECIIKAFGGLHSDNINEHRIEKTEPDRRFKNATIALTLLAVMVGLTLLYFFPEITVSHEPLGWFMLIIANTFPVIGFGAYYNDNWLKFSSVMLVAGISLLFAVPELSSGLDHHVGTEVGVGLALVLAGFVTSLARMAYQIASKKEKNDALTVPHCTTPIPTPTPQPAAQPHLKAPLQFYNPNRSLLTGTVNRAWARHDDAPTKRHM